MMKVTKRLSVYAAALFCSLFIFAIVQNAHGQVPRQFNYQGLIQSPNGQPIQDGDHNITVSLYSSDIGGVALYSETHVVKLQRGIFSVQVGSKSPIPFAFKFDGPLFLALSVDGSSELSPRTPIVAVPYSLHSEVAEFAKGLASDARGVVTSINEVDGALNIVGDSTILVKQTGKVISLHAYPKVVSQGLAGIQAIDKSVVIQNGNGPFAGVGVADSGITTSKLADGSVTPLKINQAGATLGQILKWNGVRWIPSNDSSITYTAGTGISIINNTITILHPLPVGTIQNSTLRWDGINWVENQNFTSTQSGLTVINNDLTLANNGGASALRLLEPIASGNNFTAFKATSQSTDITYTLPAALPTATGYLSVDNTGAMTWSTSPAQVSFDQITAGVNLGQSLTVGGGSVLSPIGSGIITANRFVSVGSTSNAVDLATSEVGGILPITNGGTNSGTALNNNRLMYSNGGAIVEFASGNNGQVLMSTGSSTPPSWASASIIPNGTVNNSTLRWNLATSQWQENTNILSSAAGQLTVSNGIDLNGAANPILANGIAGSVGQALLSNGPGNTPIWTSINTLPTGTVTSSTLRWNGTTWVENTNVLSSASGLVTVNAGVNLNGTTSPIQLNGLTGTTGQVLTSAGAGTTPTWTTINTLPTGTLTNSTLRWNGSAWVENTNVLTTTAGLVTANAGVNLNGTTSPMQLNGAAGTSGQVLTSAGVGLTPTWTTINTLPTGSGTDNTLRWNGTSWVETALVKSSSTGLVTANGGVNLNGTTSTMQLNGVAGTTGQVLTSAGAGTTPTWTTINTLPTGTLTNSTLRWNGSAWVENTNVLTTTAGLVTANAGVNLSGTTSALQLNGVSGTTGQVLTSGGAGLTPTWTTVNLLPTGTVTNSTMRWSGTAWVENTNVLSTTAGLVTVNAGINLNGTTSPMQLNGVAGTTGQVLTSAGAGVTPTWTTINTLPTGTLTNSTLRWTGSAWVENTNVLTTTAGLVTANAGVNLSGTTSPLQLNGTNGTVGQVLTSAGANTPTWTTINTLPTGTLTNSTLRWNGTAWVENTNVLTTTAGLVTANAGVNLNGTTSPLQLNGANGTSGQILTSAGAGTPTWTTLAAGTNVTLTNVAGTLTIAATGGLANGTAVDNTLRWNGTNWVETSNVTSSTAGLVKVNAGVQLNSTASPLILNSSAGTTGQFLTSAGAGVTPTWTTGNLLSNGTATDNTLRWNGTTWVETSNVTSSTAGLVKVNAGLQLNLTASPLILNASAGTTGQVLTSAGAGATPTWTTLATLTAGTAVDNTLRWNGTNWVETSNVTSSTAGLVKVNAGVQLNSTASPLILNSSAGTTGQFLTSAGAGVTPTWTTGNLLSNGTATDNTLRWNGTTWVETANVTSSTAGLVKVNAGLQLNLTASPLILNASAGTTGQVLTSAGAGATPTWTTLATLTAGTAVDNTLRWNGTNWVETSNVTSSTAGLVKVNAGVQLNSTASPLILNSSAGTTGQFLTSAGAGVTPTWTTGNLLSNGTATDNTLRWNGTAWVETSNVTSSTAGLVKVNAGLQLNLTASPLILNASAGTTGQVLTSAGAGATPTWTTLATLTAGTAVDNTLRWNGTNWVETSNVTSSTAGLVKVNAGVQLNSTASPLILNSSAGTTGQFLTSAGAGVTPTWTTGNLLSNGTATDNTLRWNGTAWVETSNVTSSAAGLVKVNAGVNLNGATSPLQLNGANGTSGQILTSAGAGTPTWTTLAAGTNVTLTNVAGTLTIAATGGLANGTAVDNTLRWNGTNWVETSNVTSSTAGLVKVNAGVQLNSTASPLILNASAGTTGQFLTSAGAGVTPTWTTGNLLSNGTATDNTLRWNGTAWVETANVTSTAGGLLKVNAGVNLNGTNSPLQLNTSAGTTGQFLTSAGAGATPTWTTGSLLPNGTATDNTLRWNGTNWVETANVTSTSAGLLKVNAGVNFNGTTSPLLLNTSAGTAGQFLTSAGAGATPTWSTGSLLPNGTGTDNTLRWNGAGWVESSVVTSSATGMLTANGGLTLNGTSSPLILNTSAGTSGQFLVSQGVGATPQWQTINLLPNGSLINSTLRWSGTAWVENLNVTATNTGLVTVNAGLTLNGGTSPLILNNTPGVAGQFLKSQGLGNTPVWATGTLVSAGTGTDNTLRWNGSAWVESSLVTSSATGLLSVNGSFNLVGLNSTLQLNGSVGTSGQVLTSGGLGLTPTWTTIASIANGTALDNTLRWNGTNWVETANVTSSAAGLLGVKAGITIFNTTSPFNVRGSDGTLNYVLTSQGLGATPQWVDPNSLVSAWKLAGNTGTTPGTAGGQNYMGTTDAKDLVFATNGLEHLRISSTTATTNSTPIGVVYARAVLPGGASGLFTGMTIETVLPSSALAPSTSSGAFGGLFSSSTISNGVALGASSVYCAFNSTVTINGSANTNTIRANDGIVVVDNSSSGLTHSTLIGSYGSIRTNSTSNSTTITDGAALRSNFVLNSTSSVVTNADGLLIENPTLGGGVPNTAITTYNGVRVQNLSVGTTKRAFLYDGTGSNVPVAITSAGQVGIGRKDPTQALEVYNGNILISNNTNTAGLLELAEPSGSGSNFTALRARAQAADITYDLPNTQPSTNQVLTATAITGAGPYTVTLDWQNGGASSGWSLTGNAATTPGTNYLGTTDNQAFEIHVFETDGVNKGSKRVMRYEPNATSANIIGGYNGNTITSGVGSVISGGGYSGNQNSIGDNYGFVGGGAKNTAGNSGSGKTFATVGGGFTNIASGQYSVVGGGTNNNATGTANAVLGGDGNVANGSSYGMVIGGHQNLSSSVGAIVVGGDRDTATGQYSFIGGGQFNLDSAQYSVISGGSNNLVPSAGDYSVIPGGQLLKLGSNSFGVNMTAASDVRAQANIAYFGNMNIWIGNTNSTSRELRFYGSNGSSSYAGAHYSAFKAGAQTTDITYTLPTAQPTDVGQVLGINTSGASPVLEWTGSSRGTVTSQNAAYTALLSDRFIFVTNAGAGYNLTLPTAANKGQMITVTKTDNNANTITVVAPAGQAIVQIGTPATLNAQGKSVTLVADGTTTWYVVSHE